jgi:hypothetical protein
LGIFLTAIGAVAYEGVKAIVSSSRDEAAVTATEVTREGKFEGRASIESAIGECVNLVLCGTSDEGFIDVIELGSSIDEKGIDACFVDMREAEANSNLDGSD